jgi:hypothetical protein
MYQCFQDGLALARYFNRIDIFMTVTCNPKWPEIISELRLGQTTADRPDLVARVFGMKKDAIVDIVYKQGVLVGLSHTSTQSNFRIVVFRTCTYSHLLNSSTSSYRLRTLTPLSVMGGQPTEPILYSSKP